jgi:hypothetical protein
MEEKAAVLAFRKSIRNIGKTQENLTRTLKLMAYLERPTLFTPPDCANTPMRAPSGEALFDSEHQRMRQTTVGA